MCETKLTEIVPLFIVSEEILAFPIKFDCLNMWSKCDGLQKVVENQRRGKERVSKVRWFT